MYVYMHNYCIYILYIYIYICNIYSMLTGPYIQNIGPEFCVRGCDISHPRTQNEGPIYSI